MSIDRAGQDEAGGGGDGLTSDEQDAIIATVSTGHISGGELSRQGGLNLQVAAGEGAIGGTLGALPWAQTDLVLDPNETTFVFVNSDGAVMTDTAQPDILTNVQLGIAITDGASIVTLLGHTTALAQTRPKAHDYTDDAVGTVVVSGCQITPRAGVNLQLDLNSGEFYTAYDNKHSLAAAAPVTGLVRAYRDGAGGYTYETAQTAINDTKIDDGTGTLLTMTAGKWKKDLSYAVMEPDGTSRVIVFYGRAQYDTQAEAELADIFVPEETIHDKGMRCAGVVVQKSAGDIASCVDYRPFLGQSAPATTAVTAHNDLTGRDAAGAHDQYLLRDGSDAGITGDLAVAALKTIDGRDISVDGATLDAIPASLGAYLKRDGSDAGMSGDLDMNGGAILVPGLVDGRDVSADGAALDAALTSLSAAITLLNDHSARHDPGSADALTTAAATTITGANGAGAAASYAKSDHDHALANDLVTFAIMQNIATDRLLGRDTAATGDPEEIAVGGGLEFTGAAAIQRSALTGDITASAGSNATTIPNNTVTFAKQADIGTDKLVGRDTAATGDPEEISVGGGLEFTGSGGIQRSALTGDVTAPAGSNAQTIPNDTVTFAKIQNITTDRLLGRDTAATGDVEEITVGGGLEFSGATAIRRSALTGDVVAAAGSNATVVDTMSQDMNLTGVLTPSTLAAGDNNDYNPTNLATSSILRLTPHAQGSALTGLAGGASGRVVIIKNIATYELLRLKNENASATAAMRFSNGYDVLVQPGELAIAVYDATTSRWVVVDSFAMRDRTQRREPILEDFDLGSAETGEIGQYGWTFTTFGIVGVNAVQNHPGIVQTQSSATIGAVNRLKLSNADTGTMLRHDEWREMTLLFAPATATFDLDYRFGLMSDASANPPGDGVYVEKLAADANYQLVTRASAAQTRTGSGQAAANGTYIKITARKNGTNIDWFVNDVYVTQSTATLPAAATGLLPVHQQIPTATNARSWNTDLFHLHFQNVTR